MIRKSKSNRNPNLRSYIKNQRELIKLEYELETKEKQKTKIESIDLCFILRTKTLPGEKIESRKWTTTLPLPKNLIPPEYLIINDPTYVNVSDKMCVEFLNCDKDPIKGTVMKIRDGELTALFELDWEEDSARHQCSIAFLPNDTVYKRKMDALNKLNNLNANLKNMLCRIYPTEQNIPDIELKLPMRYDFNESQIKAIKMAVSNPFSLIQGPPGTGKTHTIGAIAVQALRKEPGKKVLICGTTNVSISSLLEIVGDMVQGEGYKVCWPAASTRDFVKEDGLTEEQKLMTLYKCRHIDSKDGRRFKKLHDKYNPTEQETREMNYLRNILEKQIITESNVIFATLDSSGKRSIAQNIGKISTLIVDEATLSVESSMIIPLSLCPDRFVLVGDHKQLGPQPSYKELEVKGYYYSMFQRIIKEKICLQNSVMLNTQYRMHPDISQLPNNLFYDNELIDGVHPNDRKISKNFILQKHLNFINFNKEEERNGTSYFNQEEITLVYRFVQSLIESGVQNSQIGVICAYGAQAQLISENFKWNSLRVKVSTIDSFQGSQKDYIIICTTRCGTNLGFLNDERRMNVAITRARCLVAIFGNAETLSQSPNWNTVIQYSKENKSYYDKLPFKFGLQKPEKKALLISRNTGDMVKEMVTEFKEESIDAGYNLNEIKSEISDSHVRVLWPDEKDDIMFLENWVQKRINILNKNKHVTLAYDAESVCLQFGDIFDDDVDYYNWESDNIDIPEIKTNESIIISFYEHKGNHQKDPILVQIMKPLLEHPKITLITFDFTFDFDTLFDFNINIKTTRIVDIQLANLPEDTALNEKEDFICSTGWKSIAEYIYRVNEDNVNSNIITRAKKSIKSGAKKFPHEENGFLIKQFNIPLICEFTKLFLEYSAGDIFYTAIAGIDLLSRGELEDVKERSTMKFDSFKKYRSIYGSASIVREAYYVRESFASVTQAQFSKESKEYQIMSYYKKLNSFVKMLDDFPKLLPKIIPQFKDDDITNIRQRYNSIIDIMKNPQNEILGNIKDKAVLSHVQGVQKNPAFVLRFKEEEQPIEEFNQEDKVIQEKQENNDDHVNQVDTERRKRRRSRRKKNKSNNLESVAPPGEQKNITNQQILNQMESKEVSAVAHENKSNNSRKRSGRARRNKNASKIRNSSINVPETMEKQNNVQKVEYINSQK